MAKQAVNRKKKGSIIKQLRKLSLHSQREAVEIKFSGSHFKRLCTCCPKTYTGEICPRPRCLEEKKTILRSSLDKAFSKCLCRKLSIEKIELDMFERDFDVPSAVFQVKSLKNLSLERCSLKQLTGPVRLECLETLFLEDVFVEVDTLEMLLSSCPLIENLVLEACPGLTAPNVIRIKHNNLKHLSFSAYLEKRCYPSPGIEIDAPNLTSLSLTHVQLYTNSFENLSSNFPRLVLLSVLFCKVDGELKLSSRSIECLTLSILTESIKATIDAPNLYFFNFTGKSPQASLTFAPTSREWNSHVEVGDFRKLGEVLRALSESQISIDVRFDNLPPIEEEEEEGGFEPVAVKNLNLDSVGKASPSLPHLLNGLFSVCRPRYTQTLNDDNQLFEFLCKVLVLEREKRDYLWQWDLERVGMEVWDREKMEWKPTRLPQFEMRSKRDFRFRLKWSDKEVSKQALILGSLSLHTLT